MKNEYSVNWKLYKTWLIENMLKTPKLQFKIFWCVMTILCAALFFIAHSYVSFIFALYCIYRAFIMDYIAARKQYGAMAAHHQSKEWTRTILFEDEIIEVKDGDNSVKYDYSRISGIRENGDKIYLDMDDNMVVRMYQSAFVDTDWAACRAYIESRRNK